MPSAKFTSGQTGIVSGSITKDANAAVQDALRDAAEKGAEVAAAIASQRVGDPSKRAKRYRDLPHMSDIRATRVFGTDAGWGIFIRSPVYWAWFQSEGTVGSRKRKVKKSTEARRQSGSGQARYAKMEGNAGIKPLRFMTVGGRVARSEFLPALKRRLPG